MNNLNLEFEKPGIDFEPIGAEILLSIQIELHHESSIKRNVKGSVAHRSQ